jgi:hypothetical protein
LAICLNNLRQVGRAMLSWNAEHGAADPWRVDFSAEGTRNHPSGLQNNLWFQFTWVSNELRTPRILACPSDSLVKVASDFGFSSNGYLHATMRNAASSYFLGIDSRPDSPQTVLSGDRNARLGPASGGCSSGLNPVYQIDPRTTGWNETNLHGPIGNLLFHDGRVELQSSAGLRQALEPGLVDENGAMHLLSPRNND